MPLIMPMRKWPPTKKRANVEFVSDVANHVSSLLTGYHRDLQAMGAATKRENAIFVADIAKFLHSKNRETKVMMDGFNTEHTKMAKVTKADRKKFINKLENSVGVMRKDNVNDLVGAGDAWASLSPQGRKAKLMTEQRAKSEQEKSSVWNPSRRARLWRRHEQEQRPRDLKLNSNHCQA